MSTMWDVVRSRFGRRRSPSEEAPRLASDISQDFEDMMELYEPEIDDALTEIEPRSRAAVARDGRPNFSRQSSYGQPTSPRYPEIQQSYGGGYSPRSPEVDPLYGASRVGPASRTVRVCADCLNPSCTGQCRRRFDPEVEEDTAETSPMLRNSLQRIESLPYADDSPRSSTRSYPPVESGRTGSYRPRLSPVRTGDEPPTPPVGPPPDSPGGMDSWMSKLREERREEEDALGDIELGVARPRRLQEARFLHGMTDPGSGDLHKPSEPSLSRTHHPGEGASPQLFDVLPFNYDLDQKINPRKEPKKFFKFLIKAIKTNSPLAVEVMCKAAHEAQIDLSDANHFTEKRYTATALHVALLFKRQKIAKLLITWFPKLVTIPYTSKYLRGQTAFHIAAANNDLETMDLMLKVIERTDGVDGKVREIDSRATGTYFEESHHEGALALTAALWAGQVDMIGLLLMNGANMHRVGPCGNTSLHHLVFFSDEYPGKQEKVHTIFQLFWEFCDEWWSSFTGGFTDIEDCDQKAKQNKVSAMRHLLSIRNNDQQTPLTLAVNLQAPIAKYLLNFEPVYRLPQTKFGSTSWITYDVTEVTSYGSEKQSWIRYNPSSVLHILAHRAKIVSTDDQNFEDLIQVQPVIDLVKMKWKVYRWIYYLWAIFHFVYMAGFTWFATHYQYLRYEKPNSTTYHSSNVTNASGLVVPLVPTTEGSSDANKHLPWLFMILPLVYIVVELEDIIFVSYRSWRSLTTSRGFIKTLEFWAEQWTVTGNGPFRVTLMCFSICGLVWASMFEFEHEDQDIPLAFALGLGWIFMLFFTRGLKSTSRFSIMVQKMFFQDFIYFLSVYSFIWIAFASAMQALVHENQLSSIRIGDTLYSMLNIVTDAGEKATEHTSRLPKVAAMILSVYAVISVILLLNMLIAMMNASYDAVKMSKTNLYRYQQLSILLMIERRMFWFRRLCMLSQRHLWSPKTPLKDEIDGHNSPKLGKDEVEMGVMKKLKLTPKRMYVEVTERTFTEDDSFYKPYVRR